MEKKIITATEAVSKITDGAFIALGGIGVNGIAREIVDALMDRYDTEGHPKGISLIHAGGIGVANDFAREGLLSAYYSGFPRINSDILASNAFPTYSLTQGIVLQIIRAQANGSPCLSKVGLNTFLDPRIEAGACNGKAAEKPIVELSIVGGEEYLYYKIPPVNVAIIRGTTSDIDGNITTEDEPVKFELLYLAMAVHNNGGIVIAQVKNIAPAGSLSGADIKVPGILVDFLVPCTDHEKWHSPVYNKMVYGPGLTGYHKIEESLIPLETYAPKGERRVIARRAVTELRPGYICNVGFGMSDGVAYQSSIEGIQNMFYMTNELGAIGGHIGGGDFFAASFNASAYMNHHEMFDFINGRGLDMTCLGSAEIGEDGSVNVTRIAGKIKGSGGFVNIASCAHKVVFMGSMTVGGSAYGENGILKITKQGKKGKFPKEVDQISYNGKDAEKRGQEVFYITERAVFKLIGGKVTLIEFASGLDLQKDILDFMDFIPEISPDLKPMPACCFEDGLIGLKKQWKEELVN